jgi:Hsp20/alpha crystallin family
MLPQNFKQENVTSTLSSDGILTISAACPVVQAPSQDMRSVPITSVGPQKESVQAKSDEPKIEQVN